jgi:hypothetical protein
MSAIIYKITSPDGSKVYVGSTTQRLCNRKAHHHGDYKKHNLGQSGRCRSYDLFDEFGFENCLFEAIETLNEATKEQKLLRERHWVEAIGTLGQNRPIVFVEEKKENTKEWLKKDKEARPEVYKARGKANYIKLKPVKSAVVQCECGETYTAGHEKRHKETPSHLIATGQMEPPVKDVRVLTEEELVEKRRKNCEVTKRCYAKDPEKHRQRAREYSEKIGPEEKARRFKEWYDKNKEEKATKYKEWYNTVGKTEAVCECGETYTPANKSRHIRSKHHTDYLSSQ